MNVYITDEKSINVENSMEVCVEANTKEHNKVHFREPNDYPML